MEADEFPFAFPTASEQSRGKETRRVIDLHKKGEVVFLQDLYGIMFASGIVIT